MGQIWLLESASKLSSWNANLCAGGPSIIILIQRICIAFNGFSKWNSVEIVIRDRAATLLQIQILMISTSLCNYFIRLKRWAKRELCFRELCSKFVDVRKSKRQEKALQNKRFMTPWANYVCGIFFNLIF